jgi:formate hydrogenlyase transcriptional activator
LRGSIFLDEIATMGAGLQAKLLRVLQEREIEPLGAERIEHVDVRVIAATNRDLAQLVAEGKFQDDLFYRLDVVPIIMPPLRERAEDIPMLAKYFVIKHAERSGRSIQAIDDAALSSLQAYAWPGNVRELENTIERAVVLTTGSWVRSDHVQRRGVEGNQRAVVEAPSERRVDGTRDDPAGARRLPWISSVNGSCAIRRSRAF